MWLVNTMEETMIKIMNLSLPYNMELHVFQRTTNVAISIVINPIFWLNEKTHNFPLMGPSFLYTTNIHDGLQLACFYQS